MEYYTALELAKIWKITRRRVQKFCEEDRLEGAFKKGNMWLIPITVEKPSDLRKMHKESNDDV